ncbi:MAG: HAMP domain-containing histidine kinase [Propionibacteriaceae bacterium]|jgi:signal transduction histidine kinase|nr:HAMP domain-containing histidine kinase [Propionibacteriaceae bacterium]
MSPARPHQSWGIDKRTFFTVLAAAVLVEAVCGLVALLIGPLQFRDHIAQAGITDPVIVEHVGQAFTAALGLALAAGVVVALAVGWLVAYLTARRTQRWLVAASEATVKLSHGDHSVRLPPSGLGPQFEHLRQAVNAMAAQLERVERSRRDLLADLRHEIRTPLSVIVAVVDALDDQVMAPGPEAWRTLREPTQRILRLTDDIARLNDIEDPGAAAVTGPIDLADLTERVASQFQPLFDEAGVRLVAVSGEGVTTAWADDDRVAQILSNLLSNALRHTPAGGLVEIRGARLGDRVELIVADSGEGLDEEALSRAFDRFYSGDPARSGGQRHGLGLTIARRLAQSLDGDLTARSAGPGRGAAFSLLLPAGPS